MCEPYLRKPWTRLMNSCGGFPVVNFVSPALFSFIMCFPFELCFGHGLCRITSVSAWKININEFFSFVCPSRTPLTDEVFMLH